MPAVQNVLVVGAGFAGCATAILLADGGVTVDLIEQKPAITTLGSGITMQGNGLRVLRQLGVWPEIEAAGYSFMETGIRLPDPAGTLVAEMKDSLTGGPDLPATVGLPRPDVARILVDRATDAGATVRFGTSLVGLESDESGATATFADGTSARYDLVIGADGVHSKVRSLMGIDIEPQPIGMGIWRVFTARPESVTRTDLYYGGESYIAGFCPTSDDSLYAYIVEEADAANLALNADERTAKLRQLSEAYHGPWDDIRPLITDGSTVNYALFESHVVDGPWNRGRVAIIGDAAHSCPPTIAQGASMSLEDAAVLSELLLTASDLDEGVFEKLTERRLARASTVVSSSVQICTWMLEHDPAADVPGLMHDVFALVTEPA